MQCRAALVPLGAVLVRLGRMNVGLTIRLARWRRWHSVSAARYFPAAWTGVIVF